MINIHSFIRKVLIAVFALFIAMPAFAPDNTVNTTQQTAVSVQQTQDDDSLDDMGNSGDIGDYGRWATEHNQKLVIGKITNELKSFGPTATEVQNAYVPLDAKLGLAFIGGLTNIGIPLDRALSRFAIIFILIAYAFWVSFEAYNLIGANTDAKKTVQDIVVKGLIISAWLIALEFGIVKIFAMIMIPIVRFGLYISKTIWESITSAVGYELPMVCDAIKDYATNNISNILPSVSNESVSSGLVES